VAPGVSEANRDFAASDSRIEVNNLSRLLADVFVATG
jgi:hypothetical protein